MEVRAGDTIQKRNLNHKTPYIIQGQRTVTVQSRSIHSLHEPKAPPCRRAQPHIENQSFQQHVGLLSVSGGNLEAPNDWI